MRNRHAYSRPHVGYGSPGFQMVKLDLSVDADGCANRTGALHQVEEGLTASYSMFPALSIKRRNLDAGQVRKFAHPIHKEE